MVQIVIAALAKGMAVANLTLEESLTLLNASLRPFLGVGKYSDANSSVDDSYGVSVSLRQAEISKWPSCSRSIVQWESDTLYELQNQVALPRWSSLSE